METGDPMYGVNLGDKGVTERANRTRTRQLTS